MSRKKSASFPEKPLSTRRLKNSGTSGPADGLVQASPWIGAEGSAYELGEPLGEGGMGLVYRGVDRRLGRAVALKVLRPELSTERYQRKLEQEARFLAQLEHPGIVRLYTLSAHHGQPMLVMELVERGMPLARKLLQAQIPLTEVLEIGVQMLEALAYAHEKKVLHLDLSPGNVLLVPTGTAPTGPRIRVKLLDFGIAGRLAAEALSEAGIGAQTGIPWFNPTYASPEQRRGEPLDERSDLYSLSLLLWRMLVGEPPCHLGELETHPDWRHAHLFRPETPFWLDELIAQGLEPARAHRPASAHVILTRLSEYLENFPAPVPLGGTQPATGLSKKGWSPPWTVTTVSEPGQTGKPVQEVGDGSLPALASDTLGSTATVAGPPSPHPRGWAAGRIGAALGLLVLMGMGIVAVGTLTRGTDGADSSAELAPGESPVLNAGEGHTPTPAGYTAASAVPPAPGPVAFEPETAELKRAKSAPATALKGPGTKAPVRIETADARVSERDTMAVPSPVPVSLQPLQVSQESPSRTATLSVVLLREEEKEDVPLQHEAVLHTGERLFFRVRPSAAGRLWIFQCQPDNRMRPWRENEGGGKKLEGIPLVAQEWQEVPARSAFLLDGVPGWERFAFVFAVDASLVSGEDLSTLTQTLVTQKRCQSELRTEALALRGSVLVPRQSREQQARDLPPEAIQWKTDPEGIVLQTLRYRHE